MKKSHLPVLVVLFFLMSFSERGSSLLANNDKPALFIEAEKSFQQGDYEKAIHLVDSLIEKTRLKRHKWYLEGQFLKGDIFTEMAKYDVATKAYQEANPIGLKSTDTLWDLKVRNAIAEMEFRRGNTNLAIKRHQQILELRKKVLDSNHPDIADTYNNLGNCHYGLGDIEKAIHFHSKALTIREIALGSLHVDLAVSHMNLGNIQYRQGKVKEAQNHFAKAKKIREANFPANHPKLANALFAFAKCHIASGDLKTGIPLAENALEIFKSKFDEAHPALLNYFQTYAHLLETRGAYQEALTYYQKMIFSKNRKFIFIGLNNTGLVFQKMGDYTRAIDYHNQAFEFIKKNVGFEESDKAQVFLNVANAYFREGNTQLAKTAYENLLGFYGNNPPALLLNNLGLCELDLDNFNSANQYFRKAIAKADSLEKFEYQINEVIAFRQMGKHEEAYQKVLRLKSNNDKERLDWLLQLLEIGMALEDKVALESQFETAIEKVDILSRRILDPISRLKFRGNFQRVYQLATLYYSKKWKQTNEVADFEKAFSIAEKGKSLTLLESVIQKQLTTFAGVPDEVLEKEKQILQKGNQLEYEKFLKELKSKHPQYYELKFAAPSISLEAVQELLNPNQTLLSYSLSGNDLIIFQIKKDAKNIIIQPIVEELNTQLPELNSAIQNYPKLVGDDLAKAINEYQTIAFSLYQKLIPQPEFLTEELIIIPDGVLHYLSFECLLSERTTGDKFKFYPYLINSKSISYCYSASFLEQLQKREGIDVSDCLLAVAPSFDEGTYGLSELRYNDSEATQIANIYNGDELIGKQATLDNFLAKAERYSILHIATHGMANDRSGDASFLSFTEVKDSLDNEWLYAKNIYNQPLNASLVVLSACQTGLGELQEGEGLMGLSRAFFFNNAKTLVPTLWSVDDLSNSEIIVSFFENLKQKNTLSSSLRNSKLTYLKNHKNPECHPFFWAAPILLGVGDETIECKEGIGFWLYGIIGFVGILAFLFFRK